MRKIPHELFVSCCIQMEERRKNGGVWRDREIPDCMLEAAKVIGLVDDDETDPVHWLLGAEMAIASRAVQDVAMRRQQGQPVVRDPHKMVCG